MIRLLLYFVFLAALAAGLAWLADRPGNLVINWQGYEIETSVFLAVVAAMFLVGLTILAWTVLRQLIGGPGAVARIFRRRRERQGLEALSTGLIAISSGDRSLATRSAVAARKSLPNEPLTDLLRAQTAQLIGDRVTARRIYEGMLGAPDTEIVGLRGLFLEAKQENETEAARQFAERALKIDPKLAWPSEALFDIQCRTHAWENALETLQSARKHGHVDKAVADRRRAVLLTARALELEDRDMDRALALASEAAGLAPGLVPAAAVAGRLLAARGSTAKAATVISKAWKQSPNPELAVAYAYARPGDSPKDRLRRVTELAAATPNNREAPIAVAQAAIEAQEWQLARESLEPLLDKRLSQRVCVLMARIEGSQHGDTGRVREWLARAVHAERDPCWVAGSHISNQWLAVSPDGLLDSYEWKIPVEDGSAIEAGRLLLEEIQNLRSSENIIDASSASAVAGSIAGIGSGAAAKDRSHGSASGSDADPDDTGVREPRASTASGGLPARVPEADDPDANDAGMGETGMGESGKAERDGPAAGRKTGSGKPHAAGRRPNATGAYDDDEDDEEAAPVVVQRRRPKDDALKAGEPEALKSLPAPGRPVGRPVNAEPEVYFSPRLPDDPGPGLDDPVDPKTPLARFREPPARDK